MAEPIEANYVPDGDDWTITVIGRGKQLTGKAPGIIAARDRADQLVEEVAPDEEHRTVVHMLNGDAVQFTTAYLTARMAKSEPVPAAPTGTGKEQGGEADKKPAKKSSTAKARNAAGKASPSANGVEQSARPGQPDNPAAADEAAPPARA
jgi:hypothetical protein